MENSINPAFKLRQMETVKWVLLALAVLLALLTISSLRYVDRFYVEKEQLLQDPQFLAGQVHWDEKGGGEVSFSGSRLTIDNKLGASHSVFQNVVVDTPSFYQFEFSAGVEDVVPTSEEGWARASVSIIFRDNQGERIGSKMIADLVGSQAIKSFSEKLLLREVLGSVDMAFRLYRASGEFTVSNPVMSRLQEYPLYKNMRIAIIAAWVILLAILAFLLVRSAGIWNLVALMFLAGVALVGVVMPEAMMTGLNQKIVAMLPQSFLTGSRKLLGFVYDGNKFVNPGSEISKIGHFLVFALLGILAGLNWQRIGLFFAITCIAVFAVVTETLQMFVNGRTTSIGDFVTDSVGGLIGLVIGMLVLWSIQSIKGLSKKPDPIPDLTPEDFAVSPENTREYY